MNDAFCSNFGESLTFFWLEFMDPGDGIGFASSAKGIGKKMPALINLLDCAKGQKANLSSLPIPRSLGSNTIRSSKTSEHLLIYDFRRGSLSGNVAYSSQKITFAAEIGQNGQANDGWYNSPSFDIQNEQISPSIYILSGHGSQGRVYGEGDKVGGVYLHSLTPSKNLRLLIVPACSNINYYRGFRLKKLLEDNSMFAILGYEHTYRGGAGGFDVMKSFVGSILDGKPIIESWRKANENAGVKKYPWSAIVCPASDNAHLNFTLADILHEPEVIRNSWTYPIFYSATIQEGKKIKEPPITAYFLAENSASFNNLKTMANNEEFEKLFSRLDRKWIPSGSTMTFSINSRTEAGFKEGECLVFLFYVVRPDWSPLDLFSILTFEENDIGGNATVELKIQSGKPLLFVKIVRSTTNIFLKAKITRTAHAELDKAAFKDHVQNPSDLLCHCMHGVISNNSFCAYGYRESGEAYESERFDIQKIGSANWINEPHTIDLRVFPSKFTWQEIEAV